MRILLASLIGLAATVPATVASADNTVLYTQGRGWAGWNSETVSATGWNNRKLSYDGNAPIRDKSGCSGAACADSVVRNAIYGECHGNDANGVVNKCVIVCYSAGCLRTLKAIDDLRAQGYSLSGLQWVQGAGGASGGTDIASLSTTGGTKFLAKLIGQQEKVDYDLTPSAARGTGAGQLGYVQDAMWGPSIYHIAGYNDICKSLLFFKLCGNKYAKVSGGGYADGVVPHASAAGCSTHAAVTDGCACAKYPYRTFDTGYTDTSCAGSPRDHAGIVGLGVAIVGADLTGSGTDHKKAFGDATTQAECAGSDCDAAFKLTCQDDFTEWNNAGTCTTLTTNVDTKASNTTAASTYGATCRGKCGLTTVPGASCKCDAACVSYGDCCSDYSGAAQCNIVNAQ